MDSKISDHDLLIRIDERTEDLHKEMKDIRKDFNNHLQHHFYQNLTAWSAALAAIGALVLALLKG